MYDTLMQIIPLKQMANWSWRHQRLTLDFFPEKAEMTFDILISKKMLNQTRLMVYFVKEETSYAGYHVNNAVSLACSSFSSFEKNHFLEDFIIKNDDFFTMSLQMVQFCRTILSRNFHQTSAKHKCFKNHMAWPSKKLISLYRATQNV